MTTPTDSPDPCSSISEGDLMRGHGVSPERLAALDAGEPLPAYPKTFCISPNAKAIICLGCGLTSHNPNDVAQRYCGHCRIFHDDIWPPARQFFIDTTPKVKTAPPK